MADFTGGYSSAVNDAAMRQAQDFTNRHLAQIIQQRMLEIAQQNDLRRRQASARQGAAQTLFGPGGPLAPPDAGAVAAPFNGGGSMPQAADFGQPTGAPTGMAPGEASVPMSMPPGAPAAPMAEAGTENSPSPEPSEPQAAPIPAGWQPSPAASPALGGPEPSLGGEMSAPQSVGAPPAPPQLPRGMTTTTMIAALQKDKSMPPETKLAALEYLHPLIKAQEQEQIAAFKHENEILKAGYAAMRAESDRIRAETGRTVGGARVERMAASAANAADVTQIRRDALDQKRAAGAAPGGLPPPRFNLTSDQSPVGRAAMLSDIQNPAPEQNPVGTAGAGAGGGLSQQGLDLAAAQFARTGQLPSFSRDPLERRRIINRAAQIESEAGNTPGDTVTNRMDQKAVQQSYNAITKDLTAIGPYNNMLETNGAVAKELATKAIASSAQLANKPINWLRQNATDNPDVAKYLAQIRIFTTEAARVLNNPRLVGQLTDTARKEMEGVINGDMPLNATIGVIDRLTQDGRIRVGSMEDQAAFLKDRLAGKKDATAPAARSTTGAPAGARSFKTEAEAAAAGLAKGTKVIVNGVPGTWQ